MILLLLACAGSPKDHEPEWMPVAGERSEGPTFALNLAASRVFLELAFTIDPVFEGEQLDGELDFSVRATMNDLRRPGTVRAFLVPVQDEGEEVIGVNEPVEVLVEEDDTTLDITPFAPIPFAWAGPGAETMTWRVGFEMTDGDTVQAQSGLDWSFSVDGEDQAASVDTATSTFTAEWVRR